MKFASIYELFESRELSFCCDAIFTLELQCLCTSSSSLYVCKASGGSTLRSHVGAWCQRPDTLWLRHLEHRPPSSPRRGSPRDRDS